MDLLSGALVAAGVAWLSIVLAAFLPIPAAAFTRLRLVGAGSIALVALALVGLPLPGYAPAVWFVGGCALVLAPWPRRREALA